jgi:release factor glutamine methyltransferase
MFSDKREIDWLLREKYPRFLAEPKKYLPRIRRDLRRLQEGEPLAYVIGWLDFLGCKIDLSLRPLIPRPETEYWTEKAIACIKQQASSVKVLDVFAGSGCIGIAVLKHIPGAKVWFVDNDPACRKQMQKNLKLNRISRRRYRIKHSDILKNVRMSFDYILANPPYVPTSIKWKLPLSVRKYEKPSALFGGKDGLFYIRRILKEAKNRLKPGGELWMEFGSKQAAAVRKIAKKYGYHCAIYKDQFNRPRYARCRVSNLSSN